MGIYNSGYVVLCPADQASLGPISMMPSYLGFGLEVKQATCPKCNAVYRVWYDRRQDTIMLQALASPTVVGDPTGGSLDSYYKLPKALRWLDDNSPYNLDGRATDVSQLLSTLESHVVGAYEGDPPPHMSELLRSLQLSLEAAESLLSLIIVVVSSDLMTQHLAQRAQDESFCHCKKFSLLRGKRHTDDAGFTHTTEWCQAR